jgi:hypothetical protein
MIAVVLGFLDGIATLVLLVRGFVEVGLTSWTTPLINAHPPLALVLWAATIGHMVFLTTTGALSLVIRSGRTWAWFIAGFLLLVETLAIWLASVGAAVMG